MFSEIGKTQQNFKCWNLTIGIRFIHQITIPISQQKFMLQAGTITALLPIQQETVLFYVIITKLWKLIKLWQSIYFDTTAILLSSIGRTSKPEMLCLSSAPPRKLLTTLGITLLLLICICGMLFIRFLNCTTKQSIHRFFVWNRDTNEQFPLDRP